MPAVNERVPVMARRWTVTWTSDEPSADRPVARLRGTVWLTSAAAPETDTGPVSTLRRLDRTPASPSIDTTTGLTVIVATSKPLAGVPVTRSEEHTSELQSP